MAPCHLSGSRAPPGFSSPKHVHSGAEQSQRHDGNAVWPAIGARARGDDEGVFEPGPELGFEPAKVGGVTIADHPGEFDLDGDHVAVGGFKHDIDFALASVSAKMPDIPTEEVRIDAHGLDHQGFKESAEP